MYALQGSLFGCAEPEVDATFGGIRRIALDPCCWIDHLPAWLAGADEVFHVLAEGLEFGCRRVVMYDRLVDEPRLTWWWAAERGDPEPHPVLAEMRRALSCRYQRPFDSIGVNYYRDGHDSVAWHGDRNRWWSVDPTIAIVSTGAPRPFLLRPRGGGPSMRFELGGGDLLVMGGACQHDWEHCVPKVAQAGPRISVAFRHGTDDPAPAPTTLVARATIRT